MAKTQEEMQTPTPALALEISALRLKKGVQGAVYSGVCAAEGWRPGKRVTEADFDAAVLRFTGSAMSAPVKRGKPPC